MVTLIAGATKANAQDTTVVEIATIDFAEGATSEAFYAIDARVEADHVASHWLCIPRNGD